MYIVNMFTFSMCMSRRIIAIVASAEAALQNMAACVDESPHIFPYPEHWLELCALAAQTAVEELWMAHDGTMHGITTYNWICSCQHGHLLSEPNLTLHDFMVLPGFTMFSNSPGWLKTIRRSHDVS